MTKTLTHAEQWDHTFHAFNEIRKTAIAVVEVLTYEDGRLPVLQELRETVDVLGNNLFLDLIAQDLTEDERDERSRTLDRLRAQTYGVMEGIIALDVAVLIRD